jgi:inosine-uridine nucleoside N-ribohydrolase
VLRPYFAALVEFDSGAMSLPDVAAAVYLLRPELARVTPALVRVVTHRGYAFGQTIIGATPYDRLRLALSDEELNELLSDSQAIGQDYAAAVRLAQSRIPDNALVIADIDGTRMAELLLTDLTR